MSDKTTLALALVLTLLAMNFLPQKILLAPPTFIFWLFAACVVSMAVQYMWRVWRE